MSYQENLEQTGFYGWKLALTGAQTAFYFAILPSYMIRLSAGLDASLPAIPLPMAATATGAVLTLLGLYVMIRAFLVLSYVGKNWPGSATAYLVDKCIYGFVRHPLFWGYALFWAGMGFRRRSPGLIILSGGLGLAFAAWASAVEEPRLASAFGERYAEYRRRTPGVIPNWAALRSDAEQLPTVALAVMAAARLLGAVMWNIRATGIEHIPTEGPVVFASNHMSIADPHALAFFVNRPIHYVTADEAFRDPILRWFLHANKAICKRKWGRDISALRAMRRCLDAGEAVGIFPQGQYNWDGGVNVVSDEVYRVLHYLGAPVVPVTSMGAHESWPAWSTWPAMCDWEVRFFPAVNPADYQSVTGFRQALESKMFSIAGEPPLPRRALASHRGITIVAWGCLECGGAHTLGETSSGLECSKCGARWTVTRDLRIVNEKTGQNMVESEYRAALIEKLRRGEMEDAPDGVYDLARPARAYRIGSSSSIADLGSGTLRLANHALTFSYSGGSVEVPISDVNFTFLDSHGHLVVSEPEGAYEFDIKNDSTLRWEDYLMAARGLTTRRWPTAEEIRARSGGRSSARPSAKSEEREGAPVGVFQQ
ncbi:MAG: 1-acyl-sn-glycerol-3-phosphate acyltransferase [Clostridia bacterium]|nr:1-acyl-sn-glycerol-3-phosphate acyltransferase [Clostridia bacterium]